MCKKKRSSKILTEETKSTLDVVSVEDENKMCNPLLHDGSSSFTHNKTMAGTIAQGWDDSTKLSNIESSFDPISSMGASN